MDGIYMVHAPIYEKHGRQGLDLTAANHAVLVESQWNPMLEEQAISRLHHLRQDKVVTAIRLIVKDTWEEKILAVQERKKTLADLVMNDMRLTGEDKKSLLWVSLT
jgi:SWI/SNF-related matrix-associated actin-dependent regulator of chromatin subfamily A3